MTLAEERAALYNNKRGRISRKRARDPWLDLPFRGLVPCDGRWIDLRLHETGIISGRALPAGMGICTFCMGWRPENSVEPCEDPPQIKSLLGPDEEPDHLSRWYEERCFFGGGVKCIGTYTPSRKPLGLYWVETDDHGEDWFVVARTSRQACSYHEAYEGYDTGDAYATRVAQVPSHWLCHGMGHPLSDAILRDCGGAQVGDASQWKFNGVIYREGNIVKNVIERTEKQ